MKIFPVKTLAEIDAYTVEHEPILSVNLMERAARKVFDILKERYEGRRFIVVAGPGNNGGDALAIARMLLLNGFELEVLMPKSEGLSPDTQMNRERLRHLQRAKVYELDKGDALPEYDGNSVVLDGLFGNGLNRPLEGAFLELVKTINSWKAEVLSIDLPSGLMGESNAENNPDGIIRADYTFTFQFPKLSFMFPHNDRFIGKWELIPIGLHQQIIDSSPTSWYITEANFIKALFPKRGKFMHKGDFGHVLLIAGSYGKMGAAVLAARACMKSGAGLLTVQVPNKTCHVIHCSVPEAMVSIDRSDLMFTEFPALSPFKAVGVGPAIGCRSNCAVAFTSLLDEIGDKPLVIDADAITILAANPHLISKLPRNSVITPHPGEFKRLVGAWSDEYQRLEKALEFAVSNKVVLVLKGAYTTVVTPEGECFFNPTGNPGMATAGSGDVLTGIILSFLGQGMSAVNAARAAAYIHGLAGDLACEVEGEAALTASDIVNHLGSAICHIQEK